MVKVVYELVKDVPGLGRAGDHILLEPTHLTEPIVTLRARGADVLDLIAENADALTLVSCQGRPPASLAALPAWFRHRRHAQGIGPRDLPVRLVRDL